MTHFTLHYILHLHYTTFYIYITLQFTFIL